MSRCYRVGNGALSPDGPPRPCNARACQPQPQAAIWRWQQGSWKPLLVSPGLLCCRSFALGRLGCRERPAEAEDPCHAGSEMGSPPMNCLHHVPPAPCSAASSNTWNCSRCFCACHWEQQGEACTGTGFLPSSLTEVLATPAPCPALFHTLPSSFASEVAQAGAPGRGG